MRDKQIDWFVERCVQYANEGVKLAFFRLEKGQADPAYTQHAFSSGFRHKPLYRYWAFSHQNDIDNFISDNLTKPGFKELSVEEMEAILNG